MRTDCHVQVFDPGRWRPIVGEAVAQATASQLSASLERRGIERCVLVQPRAYRTAHGCFLDALRRLGGAARGVAAASRHTLDVEVREWSGHGVRAVWTDLGADGWSTLEEVLALDDKLPLRWPVELAGGPQALAAAAPLLARAGRSFICPLRPGALDWEPAVWTRLLWWAEMGNLYFKLVALPQGAAHALAKLAGAIPDRLLWGSGWPAGDATQPPGLLAGLRRAMDANAHAVYGFHT